MKCTRCGKYKEIGYFFKNSLHKNGDTGICKMCASGTTTKNGSEINPRYEHLNMLHHHTTHFNKIDFKIEDDEAINVKSEKLKKLCKRFNIELSNNDFIDLQKQVMW